MRMGACPDIQKPGLIGKGIALGRGQTGMAQQVLYHAQVGPAFHKVGRKGMS